MPEDLDSLVRGTLSDAARASSPLGASASEVVASGRRRVAVRRTAVAGAAVLVLGLGAGVLINGPLQTRPGGYAVPILTPATAPASQPSGSITPAGPSATGVVTPTPRPRSALEDYPGFRIVDTALDEALERREFRARQVVTKQCMASKGWTYRPMVWPESSGSYPLHEWSEVDLGGGGVADDPKAAAFTRDLVGTATTPPPGLVSLFGAGGCSKVAFDAVYDVYALHDRVAHPQLAADFAALTQASADDFSWLASEFVRRYRTELDAHAAKLAANEAFVDAHQR